ncbi:unnamed protein product [Oikopleura dioica]|uniref:Protein Dr1 n=1 Tax=Oikopleura dioica TaxID=34765 RepID=E4XA29_OIKDI|nr:unnamed protein product [Oikopleura dioica]
MNDMNDPFLGSGTDDDLSLPQAAVNKFIKETIPNLRISKDARQLVADCCTQFIHHMATTSSQMCEAADKKTIAPDHVLEALKMLGFHEMVPECEKVLVDCKEENAKRKKPNKLSNSGLSEEELYRQQKALIDAAKNHQLMEEQNEFASSQHFQNLDLSRPNEDDDEDFDS